MDAIAIMWYIHDRFAVAEKHTKNMNFYVLSIIITKMQNVYNFFSYIFHKNAEYIIYRIIMITKYFIKQNSACFFPFVLSLRHGVIPT